MTTPQPDRPPVEPDRIKKGMAITISILCGTVAALVSYTLSRLLDGTPLIGLGFSGTSFMAITTLVVMVEKELDLL
ncbi:hypothetical protein ACIF6H_12100 [Streptomyces microflavus]|uniref:hypothetical protein n=1 Tax=Streptomyces microflavus TaxID=1919 RepID=UPI0037D41912